MKTTHIHIRAGSQRALFIEGAIGLYYLLVLEATCAK